MAQTLVVYPWQQQPWRQLLALVEQDRMPHALMLAGAAEIGKQQLALQLAYRLLCHSPLDNGACGRCKSCLLLQAGSHPDFYDLAPEETGKAIKVDQVRELGEFAVRTAAMGARRVVIVRPAEAMNLSSANAFLKTLEEPGKGVTIILVAHEIGRILATIRSRCRIVPLPLPDNTLVANWLRDNTSSSRDIVAAMSLSGGRPLRAQRLLDTDLWDQLQKFNQTLDGVANQHISTLEGAKTLQELDKADTVEWLQYRVYASLHTAVTNGDSDSRPWFRFLDRLNTVRQRLFSTANPNPQLVWEEVLMDWKSVIDLPKNSVN